VKTPHTENPEYIELLLNWYGAWLRQRGRPEDTAALYTGHIRAAAEAAGSWDKLLFAQQADIPLLERAAGWETPPEKWRQAVMSFFCFLAEGGVRTDDPMSPKPHRDYKRERPACAPRTGQAERKGPRGEPDGALIRGCLVWLRARRLSEGTVAAYANVLRTAAEMAGGEAALSAADCEDIHALHARWISEARPQNSIWHPAVNNFFRYLVASGLREDNPVGTARDHPEKEERERQLPSLTAQPELERLRDRAILTLLAETDLRPDVLRTLTVGCYDRKLGRLRLKGGRVSLDGNVARALEAYLFFPRDTVPEPEEPLFADTGSGGALPEAYFFALIRRGLRLAELAEQQPVSA
jgi:site-specific recombinase XerD